MEEVENAEYAAPLKPLLSMRGEEPLDEEIGPPIMAKRVRGLQEEIGGEKAMLRWAYPPLMAVEARVHGRYLPTEGGPRTEDYHLATRGGPEGHEEHMGCPYEDPRGG